MSCEDDGPDIDVESAIPVEALRIEPKPISEYVFATGTVVAEKDALLKAEQSGYYQLEINSRTGKTFAMGDTVRSGDLIVSLKNPEFVYSVQFDSKKINYDVSKREFDKQKSLYDKGGVTLRELANAEQDHINARYAYDNALLQLGKLKFEAPYDGILVDLPFYSPGSKIDVGSIIVRVMDYSTLHTEISLPGKDMGNIEVGDLVMATNYSQPEDTLTGVVEQVSPAVDPDSRTFKVGVEISNDSLILRPGMFVKLDIVVDSKDSAIVIPKDVILDRRGSKTVFVVEKGVALERQIETGLSNPDEVEVISGLEAEERLVVRGFETLRNRSKIKVIK